MKKRNIPFTKENGVIKYDHNHEVIRELLNSTSDLNEGIGLRLAGEEFGATTLRARRTGLCDLEALRYAIDCNGGAKKGNKIFLTKVDVASGMENFSLVEGYSLDGKRARFSTDSEALRKVKTQKRTFAGYPDISEATSFEELPRGLIEAMNYTKKITGATIIGIGTGCDRDAYLMR